MKIKFTDDYNFIKSSNVIFITLGTPIDEYFNLILPIFLIILKNNSLFKKWSNYYFKKHSIPRNNKKNFKYFKKN